MRKSNEYANVINKLENNNDISKIEFFLERTNGLEIVKIKGKYEKKYSEYYNQKEKRPYCNFMDLYYL